MEMLSSFTDGQRLYVDPSSYGNMLAALTKYASEISGNYVELQNKIGAGELSLGFDSRPCKIMWLKMVQLVC